MLTCSPEEMAKDMVNLLLASRPLEKVGVCCINMDAGTPDENVYAVYEVIEKFRKYGA